MAKCSLCKAKKGKRKCLAEDSFIYHFNDVELNFKNKMEEGGFRFFEAIIEKELSHIVKKELCGLLGTIRRSIKRHTTGKREYLTFIHQYVGVRVEKGMRVIPNFLTK